jgi:DNA mismatch endonuclease Vsr
MRWCAWQVASGKWQVARKARASVLSHDTRHLSLTVRPDFVFLKSWTAVFVDGCFWHGCPRHATKPANNRAFWKKKLAGNKTRDRLVNRTLRRAGWKVVRIWEHELARQRGCVKGFTSRGGKHRTTNSDKSRAGIQHSTSNADRLVRRIQRALGE